MEYVKTPARLERLRQIHFRLQPAFNFERISRVRGRASWSLQG